MHAIDKYIERRERERREREGESGLRPNRGERRRRGFNKRVHRYSISHRVRGVAWHPMAENSNYLLG